MSKNDLIIAFQKKDPIKRTDAEQTACIQLRKAFEEAVFPENKAHAEQSHLEGKDLAEENNLGSEQPNSNAVVTELNNLSQAEDSLQELMDSNDVFSEEYKRYQSQGLTNPQIYDALVQQSGLTVEDLEPFARYINANARVQGMQQATAEAIEQRVDSMAGDWGFHGTMDGQKADGSQMLYVQDSSGRTLIVGSGDVAYAPTTGKAKEGVGDMLVCLDPNTREMAYIKVEDTTLFQTQSVEDFKNEERTRLQQINSEPYNQAAAQQAAKDAAKPQPKEEGSSLKEGDTISNDGKGGTDNMGNTLNSDGSIYTEKVNSLDEIKDEEFDNNPTRSVELPQIPDNVATAIGTGGKPVIIKKNIFKKNYDNHLELDASDSRAILQEALYNPNLVGQTQPIKRPSYKVAIKTGDKNSIVVLDVYDDKKQVEIVGWRRINEKGLAKMQRQAEREGGQFLILSPNDGSAAALSTLPHGSSSARKDTNNSSNGNENNTTLTFADGSPVPMVKDSKGRPTPDYANMKPGQAAEVLTQQFGENAEKVVDGQIKKAEKAVKDAEKMKVDYTTEPNDILEQEQQKKAITDAANKQLEHAQAIKKAMTQKKVAETMAKPEDEAVEGANQASSAVAEKFSNAPRLVGNKRTRTLPNSEKIKGHYEIVPAESLTPSHDAMNGYKKSEGFPVDENGRTINDRDYENDKAAQQTTDQMALKYNGQAIDQVPVVSDEGIVYDGNGRTMAGQKAAKDGTDGEYISDLLDNAENFGFTREQIENSGIEHPRLVLVTDERMPYDTATFAKFNRNEKKAQSNTEQAVAKSKTLTSDEIGSIVADIEGNGSLEAFFNNPKAISDLVKTLQNKGIIGQNEVAGLMEGEYLNPQGKELVKNILLGAAFKPETIRMMGIDSAIKTKVVSGIRAVLDNMKLGDYALRDEIDQSIQLLYEARTNKMNVDDLLRSSDFVNGNARDRYAQISQALAQALENKATLFRDLMREYNEVAKSYNTNEGSLSFYEHLSKDELLKEFVEKSNIINDNNIKLYGEEGRHSEQKDGDVPTGNEERPEEAGDGAGEEKPTESQQQVDEAVKKLATDITKQTGVTVHTNEKESQKALEDAEATDSNIKYHKETDKETLERLEKEPKIKVYRAMQVIDGKLYPPMAASVGGKLVEANELGTWIRADENPNLAIPDIDPKTGKQKVDPKTGELKWKFKLDKGGKDATGKKATAINAAYNPYWHLSRSPLNDQFKSAWIRPNVVVVECEVPESELSSGYKAERAKDAVGEVDWKSGSVSGEVFKQTGRARKVILSRWCKPVRVLDDAEVAQKAKEFVGDAKVEIPENVLTPKQRIAFEEAGFKIGAPEKGVKKSEQIADALKAGLEIDNSLKETSLETVSPLSEESVKDSAISSDAVAKVRENLDSTKEIYKNSRNKTRGFITDISQALGLQQHEASHYGKFRTADGREFVIRISNHNTNARTFDENGESEGISIVISRGRNKGIRGKEDTRAHVVEFFYSKKSIDRAEGKPLVDIIDSLKDTIVTGEYKDKTGLAHVDEVNGSVKEFRTKDGEVYGFVVDGEIHLDTKKMKPETPLHEYTHLWTSALQRVNSKEWENVKGLLDSVDGLKEEVQKLYPELEGDDLYDEMLATYSGREGAKKLEETAKNIAAEEGKTLTESVKAKSFLGKVKEALKRYWNDVADMLGIHFTSAEDVADKVLADWASGVNPNKIKPEEKSEPITVTVHGNEHHFSSEEVDVAKKILAEYPEKPISKMQREMMIGYDTAKALAKELGWKNPNEKIKILPKEDNEPSNPNDPMSAMVKAADDFKKEHPMTPKRKDRNLSLTDKQKEILPKLLSVIKGSMYARIKDGIYNLEDVIENVRKDFKAFFDALDKDDANKILAEAAYKGRFTDPDTGERIKLSEAAERERKLSPEHQDKLVGDSKTAEERKQREESFISNLKMIMGGRKIDGIRELRQLAKELGLEGVKDTDLQELAETAVVSRAFHTFIDFDNIFYRVDNINDNTQKSPFIFS